MMHELRTPLVCRLALLAPLVFAAHVAEEAPGFVAWINSLVEPRLSQNLFLAVNAVGFVVTVTLVVVVSQSCSRSSILTLLGWLSFLMLGNGILHVTATLVLGRYSPGTATSVLFYFPFFFLFLGWTRRDFSIGGSGLAAIAAGSIPMLVHGYLIVFRGSRLF